MHYHDLQLPACDSHWPNVENQSNFVKQYKIQLCNISYSNLKEEKKKRVNNFLRCNKYDLCSGGVLGDQEHLYEFNQVLDPLQII